MQAATATATRYPLSLAATTRAAAPWDALTEPGVQYKIPHQPPRPAQPCTSVWREVRAYGLQ